METQLSSLSNYTLPIKNHKSTNEILYYSLQGGTSLNMGHDGILPTKL